MRPSASEPTVRNRRSPSASGSSTVNANGSVRNNLGIGESDPVIGQVGASFLNIPSDVHVRIYAYKYVLRQVFGIQHSASGAAIEADLDEVFAPELPGLDREAIREWYDGYSWRGEERVYNPFDVLLLFRNREFRAWWFETGTPTFLVETLLRRGVTALDLEDAVGSEELLSSFDVHRIEPEALLFQTGYLTIHSAERRRGRTYYRLRYPNREVRQSLKDSLLKAMVPKPEREIDRGVDRLHALLSAGDFTGVKELFQALYASIPHQWYTNNEIARYEGYYAAVFYAYFAGLEEAITVEDSDSRGRLDMAVRTGGRVYLFEFKVVEQAGEGAALAQLREKGYADKYRALGEPIHLVGVEFSSERRNVTAFETERA